MGHLNVEIKAKCSDADEIRNILKEKDAEFKGTDHQIDTYFNCQNGRLKLREGNIENNLIYYERENVSGPKQSNVVLYKFEPNSVLKDLLVKSNGILVVVDKVREIYFIENVKFHIDTVKELGNFVEIEAIDYTGNIGKDKLYEQCKHYLSLFGIKETDLLSNSYSDLLLEKKK